MRSTFPITAVYLTNIKKNRWYCHGEGKGGDAIALIQFASGCDFKGALDWLRSQGFQSYLGERPHPRMPVESYDYVDAGGAVVYSVDRYKDPKSFRQWREIDHQRVNGVAAGLYERSKFGGPWYLAKNGPRLNVETREFPAITPVPYRLPELLATRKEDGVLIAAGEKDVNTLRALNLAATCNHGGEGKWWPELTIHFKGRRVFILVDNDAAGEHHQQVVGSALTGVASEIRVVRFPELPEHGDVSDVIEILRKQGLDDEAVKQALYARLREAPKWKVTDVISAPGPVEEAPDEWLAPDMSILSQARLNPPRLPLEVFGAYWSNWITDQAEAKSCAPDYVAGGLISQYGAPRQPLHLGHTKAGSKDPARGLGVRVQGSAEGQGWSYAIGWLRSSSPATTVDLPRALSTYGRSAPNHGAH
jgi:hypothetical protein